MRRLFGRGSSPAPGIRLETDRFLLDAAAGDGDRPGPDRASIVACVEREGAWDDSWEWRPGRAGTERVERISDDRYRASTTYHGAFSVELPTPVQAVDAVRVLGEVQRTLLDAIDWGSWPDDRRRRPRTRGERYLRGLTREARKAARLLTPAVRRALRVHGEWADERSSIRAVTVNDQKAFRVVVAEDSLEFATHAAAPDRALAFMGVYLGLERDLRRVLGWEPLPPRDGEV